MFLRLYRCTRASLDDLVEISRKTFIDAFKKDNDPEDFKNYIDRAFDNANLLNQLTDKDSFFYFVYADELLAGYFKLNRDKAQTDINLPESMELERIYVLEQFQNLRIGQWMLNEACKIALDMQKEFVWLGVWEKNIKAIRFYKKNGFSKFGKHPYYIGRDKQIDWLMRFDL